MLQRSHFVSFYIVHPLTNYGAARAEFRDLLRVFSGTDMSVSHLVSLPPGLLMDCGWKGLESNIGCFQVLPECKQKYLPLCPWPAVSLILCRDNQILEIDPVASLCFDSTRRGIRQSIPS